MNPRIFAILAAAALGSSAALGAAGPRYVPMQVFETDVPAFPQDAIVAGLREGRARVAIAIDAHGRLTDALLTAYTAPVFGQAALAAARRWRYEPAQLDGTPHGAAVELEFRFRTEGTVVADSDQQAYVTREWNALFPGAEAFHPWSLGQIDRIPVPTKIVRPVFPPDLAGGTVRVSFFIDPEGRVRMAAVDTAALDAHPGLAAAAVDAVSQWRFEPPTRKGHPVLVYAEQEFKFQPAAPNHAAVSAGAGGSGGNTP